MGMKMNEAVQNCVRLSPDQTPQCSCFQTFENLEPVFKPLPVSSVG